MPSSLWDNFMMAACKRRVLLKEFGFTLCCLLISILFSYTHSFSQSSVQVRRVNLAAATLDGTDDDETIPNTEIHQCQFCGSSFDSRNGLFRHLKADERCSMEFLSYQGKGNGKDDPSPTKQNSMTKVSLLLKISYALQVERCSNIPFEGDSDTGSCGASANSCEIGSNPSDAYEIGQKVQQAVETGLLDLIGSPKSETVDPGLLHSDHVHSLIMGCTQTSVANHRPSVLAQENGISSAADFLLLNLQLPLGEQNFEKAVDNILGEARKLIANSVKTSSGAIYFVNILNGTRLPKDFVFHAEQDCTQRVYHYLLPLSWLPDGDLLESWCHNYDDKSQSQPPSNSLARLRETLQLAESISIPNRKVRRRSGASDTIGRTKKIRKGSASLNTKERLPWHNFGHAELRGDASPNQEPVWNVLDKARIKGFLLPIGYSKFDHMDSALAVLEFRGDNFLPGQVQSIVGTAVAVVHGWLPSDVYSMALSKDFLLETPTAPKDRLYCAGARFHSHETKLNAALKNKDEAQASTFDVLEYGNPTTELQRIQKQVLGRVYSTSFPSDEKWLEELENSVAPRISKSMLRLQKKHLALVTGAVADNLPSLEECISKQLEACASKSQDETALVLAYQRTLRLLREIIKSGSWPETSVARSNVIREEGDATSSGSSEESNSSSSPSATEQRGGSFTVFNTQLSNNPLIQRTESITHPYDTNMPMGNDFQTLPLGNQKFPELVESVFDLERMLSDSGTLRQRAHIDGSLMEQSQGPTEAGLASSRPPSLCCAINANASFLPHVDSGRGAGQSLSLIVGLGDYSHGGEICVEDFSHDIRYLPLEFDGWSSRHWTQPYIGERFSLVFFSPAISDAR